MKVNLLLVEPNPFRDFKVDPVDQANVRELTRSIKEHGFWGGVVARRKPGEPGTKQIVAGWTRVQAALKAKIEEADIHIGDFNDHQTVRAYADENATQRGQNTTAVAGSIAAALREILLREALAGDSAPAKRGGDQKGNGVGRDAILAELEGVTGITEHVVKRELANLKESGAYDRIVREVTAKVEAEHEVELEALAEAERRTKEAQKREAEAKAKREAAEAEQRKAKEERQKREAEAKAAHDAEARKRAEEAHKAAKQREAEAKAKREKADAEATKAKAEREAAKARETKHAPAAATRAAVTKMREAPKHDVTFDATAVTIHLKDPRYVETFKRMATGPGQKYLPVAQQGQLAKALVAKADLDGREITSKYIEEEFSHELLQPKFLQHIVDVKERAERKAALELASWNDKVTTNMHGFSTHARTVSSHASRLYDLYRKRPSGATILATKEFRTAIESLKLTLKMIEGDFTLES